MVCVRIETEEGIHGWGEGTTPPTVAPVIAQIALIDEDYVRDIIHAFNAHGLEMLKPKWGPGRPRTACQVDRTPRWSR